jgi:DNA-binding SARP family transcriptional activator/tetratricopeptide (TPR) repeat protein
MRFGILGPITAWDGDRPLRVGGPREQKLLATLLLDPGRSITVSRLVAAVWGEDPPATARAQVHNSVAALRRNLAGDGGQPAPIGRSGPGFVIGVDDDALDASRFARQGEAATRLAAAGQPQEAVTLLQTALRLWRGAALGGIESGLLGAEARRLDEQRLFRLEQRIALQLDLGGHDAVVGELTALVQQFPLRERLVELQMLALYRAGRRQEALDRYAGMRRRLADDSGLDPVTQLSELHQAILRGDPELEQPAPVAVVVAGAKAVVNAAPAQLPVETAGFTGRGAELAVLDRLHAERGRGARPHAIAAIVGPAGVGKSALALHWAYRRLADFPDGQLYVDLHGFGPDGPLSALDALGRLLRGLGLADATLAPSVDERAAQFRSLLGGRRMVIILDNASSSEHVRPLLPGGGPQTTLITSRPRLDGLVVREGALHLEVGPLPEADAVRLLNTSAEVVDAQLPVLAGLCDRLPLALRIAAARLRAHPARPVRALVAELGDEQRRLSGLSLPSGEAAVRTAFAASAATLSDPARRLLGAMGLHPGPQPSLLACALLGDTGLAEAEKLVSELVTHHLVLQIGPDRYRMHDLIRLYARERAMCEEPDAGRAVIDRVLRWYLEVANAADLAIRPYRSLALEPPPRQAPPFGDEIAALAWFDDQAPNLLAAVTAAEDADPVLCWQLAAVLHAWFERRQRRSEWLAAYEVGTRAAERVGDLAAHAVMLQSTAVCLSYSDRHDEAIDLFERVVAPVGDSRVVVGVALNDLGLVRHRAGHHDQAIDCYRQAAAIAREAGDPQGVSFAEGNLGLLHADLRRHDQALYFWQRAARAARQAGDLRLEADSLAGLGRALIGLGLPEAARVDLQQSLALYLQIDDLQAVEVKRLLAGLG